MTSSGVLCCRLRVFFLSVLLHSYIQRFVCKKAERLFVIARRWVRRRAHSKVEYVEKGNAVHTVRTQ